MSATEFEVQNDLENLQKQDSGDPIFFPVSVTKFLLLSICTFGLYEIYWFYKNWRLIKGHEKSKISPVWRSVFGVIFCYSLLKRVSGQSMATGGKAIPAGPLAAGWIATTLLWRLPDPYWLVSFLAIAFLLPVQSTINSMNAKVAPSHDKNARFSGWNIFGLVVGGLFFILGVIGSFLPPDQV